MIANFIFARYRSWLKRSDDEKSSHKLSKVFSSVSSRRLSTTSEKHKSVAFISYKPNFAETTAVQVNYGDDNYHGKQPVPISKGGVNKRDRTSTSSEPTTPIRSSAAFYSFVDLNDD